MQANEAFWRQIINGLNVDDGPTPEELERQELMAKDAAVLRLRFDLYLITPTEDDATKAYMVNAGQKVEDLGVMTIKEALGLIQKKKK